jgi:hypothetical protein
VLRPESFHAGIYAVLLNPQKTIEIPKNHRKIYDVLNMQRFLLTGERSFGYKRKAFRLQAKSLSLVGKNPDGASVVP